MKFLPDLIRHSSQIHLSTRIALVASTLTVLFVLIIGSTSFFLTRAQINQGIQSSLDNHAALLANRLSTVLSSVYTTLSDLRQNALILNSLMDRMTRDTTLEPFLADFSTVNGIPVKITLTDFEGVAVAGSRSLATLDFDWKHAVLEQARSVVSLEEHDDVVYLVIAEPVFYVGTQSPEGALIHQLDLSQLFSLFNDLDEPQPVTLLHQGEVVELQPGSLLAREQVGKMLTRIQPLALPDLFSQLQLSIEISESLELANQPLRRLTLVYLLLGGGLLAGVVLLSILAAGHLARPLRELEEVAAEVVASGSFEHRFEGGGFFEVTRLGKTFNQMLESLGAAHSQLTLMANQDVLTGLSNRLVFNNNLQRDLNDLHRTRDILAVLLLDLDKFKNINDTLGHPVGDELLKQVAARLHRLVRGTDTVARLGGDEFALIGTHLHDTNDAAVLAQKIIASLGEPYRIAGQDIYVSASVGVAIYPGETDDAGQLLVHADMALYKAKQERRGNYQFFDPELNRKAQQRKQVEEDIRKALLESEFRLYYQPKIDLENNRVVGVEALIRWQGKHGMIYPDSFIPVAEESRLIIPLGEWIMREACRQKLAWQGTSFADLRIAINLSVVQLGHDDNVERLLKIIKTSGVDPGGLEIEITETVLMEHLEEIAARLAAFRELGVSLAIDDIGTGYSSLSNLKRLAVDVLKIDRSFVSDMDVDSDNAAITRAIIQLGRSLELGVVAEGVETIEQAEMLSQLGCSLSQGYLYSPALEVSELEAWLAQRNVPRVEIKSAGQPRS